MKINRMRLAMAAVVVGAGVWAGWGQAAATRPMFTIGKETTIVDGPLNADGTIDYVAAINEITAGQGSDCK